MAKKKFLITGSSGFVGSNLVKRIVDEGCEVHGCDIANNLSNPQSMNFHESCKSVDDYVSLLKSIEPEYIIHCAGSANVNFSVKQPYIDFERNVISLYQLLEAITTSGLKVRMIFPSSAAVYGTVNKLPIEESDQLLPISPYGLHKKICEEICSYYVENKGLDILIARIFSAYGPGLKKQIFWDMYQKIMNSDELKLFGSGLESRDFIYIDDLVESFMSILSKGERGEIYNVASGRESTIKELAELFVNEVDKDKVISFNNEVNKGNPLNWRADISKIKKLGFTPKFDLRNGIKDLLKWLVHEK